jgi:low temperature requirement protein LtrA
MENQIFVLFVVSFILINIYSLIYILVFRKPKTDVIFNNLSLLNTWFIGIVFFWILRIIEGELDSIRIYGILFLFFLLIIINPVLMPKYKRKYLSDREKINDNYFFIKHAIYYTVMPIVVYSLSVFLVGLIF